MPPRLSDREYEAVLSKHDAVRAMRLRCDEAGHDWENCCSWDFRVYQECKWCGERR